MTMRQELNRVHKYRTKHEFIKDHSCIDCDMYDKCYSKIGNKRFSCPIENPKSDLYKLYQALNFADLCDVIHEDKDWSVVKGSERQKACALRKIKCIVSMPITEAIADFQAKYGVKTCANFVTCHFSMADLRKRMYQVLTYKPEKFTIAQETCKQLIELLVPIDYKDLFTFNKEKENENGTSLHTDSI